MFTEGTLNEIRNRLNIVELVGEYVQLKKAGQGFLGLCPFHKEKTPSFHVHPLKQCFHCFGCQKGGNLFSFYMAIEALSFPECVQRLAKRTGVTLEETQTFRREPPKLEDPAQKRLLSAQEWAARYFHYNLLEVKDYRPALEYVKSRGISEKTIRKFRLGVSPKGWNTLLTLMLKRDFSFQELVQAGLVISKEGSPSQGYDRFRQRLMFPITDSEGSVIGFGARQLTDEENQPKYINSPESPLFSKRKVLYGLYENQRGIRLRGEAVIVEGYMDVIGLHEGGIENALATMGTALTEDHCRQLRPLSRRVVTVFDPDSAGAEAWHRSVHLLLGAGMFAKDLSLPEGKDPDEFVLEQGAEKFHQLCEKAPRQITKLLKEIASRGPLSEEESAKILSDLTPILIASKRLPDRALLWDDISLVMKISLAGLKELAEGATPKGLRPAEPKRVTAIPAGRVAPRPATKPLNPVDLEFFQACIQFPQEFLKLPRESWTGGLKEAKIQNWLEKLSAAQSAVQFETILAELVQAETEGQLPAAASAGLFKEQRGATSSSPSPFAAIAERIHQRKRESEIRALSAQVRLTQRLGDTEEQLRLLARLKDLRSS